MVVQGDPGTGKTVVGIYLLKLLVDIAATVPGEELDTAQGAPRLVPGVESESNLVPDLVLVAGRNLEHQHVARPGEHVGLEPVVEVRRIGVPEGPEQGRLPEDRRGAQRHDPHPRNG